MTEQYHCWAWMNENNFMMRCDWQICRKNLIRVQRRWIGHLIQCKKRVELKYWCFMRWLKRDLGELASLSTSEWEESTRGNLSSPTTEEKPRYRISHILPRMYIESPGEVISLFQQPSIFPSFHLIKTCETLHTNHEGSFLIGRYNHHFPFESLSSSWSFSK